MPDEILILAVRDAGGNFKDLGEEISPGIWAARVNDPTVEDLLAEFRNRYDAVTPISGDFSSVGDHTLVAPAAGKRLRIVWLYAQAAGALDTGLVEVTFKRGATVLYKFELTGSQPWAHGAVIEGAVNESIIVNTSSAARVLVNADYREFV